MNTKEEAENIVEVLGQDGVVYALGKEKVTKIEFYQGPNFPEPFFRFFVNGILSFKINARFIRRVNYQ